MSTFLFILNELLVSLNAKSVGILTAFVLLIFAFLALFSSLFLLGIPTEGQNGPPLTSSEVTAYLYLSPRLSPEAVQDVYQEIREWDEVRQINFLFAQELEAGQAGGILRIQAFDPSAVTALLERLASISEIVRVDSSASPQQRVLHLSSPVRIGLLIGLAVSAFASLIVARRGFKVLLTAFAKEIQLMRLSGTTEKTIQPPIVALGALCGLLASLLLIIAVCLLHYVGSSHPEALLRAAPGLIESRRVLTVSLLSLLLGLAMGGLIGVVGAGYTASRTFQLHSQ